jgi:hypothetical protein
MGIQIPTIGGAPASCVPADAVIVARHQGQVTAEFSSAKSG